MPVTPSLPRQSDRYGRTKSVIDEINDEMCFAIIARNYSKTCAADGLWPRTSIRTVTRDDECP